MIDVDQRIAFGDVAIAFVVGMSGHWLSRTGWLKLLGTAATLPQPASRPTRGSLVW